ncbi:MAG TPA: DUF934 domain-containing protein [Hyphomicrobiaceae bacterium]|nr:DUF934 domain-containing protein [Hyphomicrobiaceae bacterium]
MPPLDARTGPAAAELGPVLTTPVTTPAAQPGQRSAGAGLVGEADANGTLWKADAFRRDLWRRAPDSGELGVGPIIVSKARFTAERGRLVSRTAPIGLYLPSGASIDDIGADVALFSLIALDFPKFSDGRGFSTARLLREKYGFKGELRAVGNVLCDQIPFMRRVGFDAFEVTHTPTRRALREGRIAEVQLSYQPLPSDAPAQGRPWLRQTQA